MKRKISKGPKSSKWFDAECKAVMRETRKWWRKFRRSKCEESKRKNRLLYVNCRKLFRSLLKQERQNYNVSKLNVLTAKMKDSKLFWSEVMSISVGTCRQPLISTNEWFTHFKNVLGGDTNPNKGKDYVVLGSPVSEEEVKNAIEHLKLNNSPGPDGILAETLKNSLNIYCHYLNSVLKILSSIWANSRVVLSLSKFTIVGTKTTQITTEVSHCYPRESVCTHFKQTTYTVGDENAKIVEEKNVFRAGHSTVDNMFV